jgi:hypothetical protein
MTNRPLFSRTLLSGAALASFVAAAAIFTGCFNVDPPTGTLDECNKNGGLCLPVGQCALSGGKVRGACYFGEGDAECCEASPPQPDAHDCAGQGGLCVELADCYPAKGYTPVEGADCGGGPSRACCLPHAVCGDAPFVCCTVLFTRYPILCDHGTFSCPPSSFPTSPSKCKEPDADPGAG